MGNVRELDVAGTLTVGALLGVAVQAGVPATPPARWCILRTSGPRTLSLARSLKEVGFDVWTPTATQRQRPMLKRAGKVAAPPREYDCPILATFVFVRPVDVPALIAIAADPATRHPGFSVFQVDGRVPVIRDSELAGLHAAECRAAEAIAAIRAGEDREKRRQERALAMRTERERRKALRATGVALPPGAEVTVQHPAFAGLTGVVMGSSDRVTEVTLGSGLSLKVETWLLHQNDVGTSPALMGAAA